MLLVMKSGLIVMLEVNIPFQFVAMVVGCCFLLEVVDFFLIIFPVNVYF